MGTEGSVEVRDADLIILCTYNAQKDERQAAIVKDLHAQRTPLVVVSVRNPYDLEAFPVIPCYLVTYDYSPANLQAAARVIAGRQKARGSLPVSLGMSQH